MPTRDPRNWKEWSLIFEAYNAAGHAQLAHIWKRIQDGGAAPCLANLNETDKVLTTYRYYMLIMLTCGRTLALVQLAEPRNGLAHWQNWWEEYARKLRGTQTECSMKSHSSNFPYHQSHPWKRLNERCNDTIQSAMHWIGVCSPW